MRILIPLPLKPLSDALNRSISILIGTGIRPPSPIGVTQSYAKKDATMTTDRSQFADDWVSAVVAQPVGVQNDLEYMIAAGVRNDLAAEDDAEEPETVWESAGYALLFYGRTMLFWCAIVGMSVAFFHAPEYEAELLATILTVLYIVYALGEEVRAIWS
jgi:hypothetical protein